MSRTPKIGTQVQLPSQIARVSPGAPGCVIVAQYPYSLPRAKTTPTANQTPRYT